MAEKMESFKEGGALWFTDLSTPDSLFILPVLSGAFFLLTVEVHCCKTPAPRASKYLYLWKAEDEKLIDQPVHLFLKDCWQSFSR